MSKKNKSELPDFKYFASDCDVLHETMDDAALTCRVAVASCPKTAERIALALSLYDHKMEL